MIILDTYYDMLLSMNHSLIISLLQMLPPSPWLLLLHSKDISNFLIQIWSHLDIFYSLAFFL